VVACTFSAVVVPVTMTRVLEQVKAVEGLEDNLWSASRELEVASRKGVDVKGTLARTGD
jgi:hypothetical protein